MPSVVIKSDRDRIRSHKFDVRFLKSPSLARRVNIFVVKKHGNRNTTLPPARLLRAIQLDEPLAWRPRFSGVGLLADFAGAR